VIFTEARFLVFFLIALAAYWATPSNRVRKVWLLGMSCIFYGAWDWRFLGLMMASAGLDYVAGLFMGRYPTRRSRVFWLVASLVGNLGLLGFFKYYDFFITSGTGLLQLLGLEVEPRTLGLVLPVGISFYTFQSLSYTIDVYRGHLQPVKSPVDFFLFVSFFPQLVAGPIVRATEFLPQLEEKKSFATVDVRACLTIFLVGFIKKACISDNVSPLTTQVWDDPAGHTVASTWIALFLWHAQIYCDFSGYSDMAVGTAGLMGYQLPRNFDFPYVARNIGEFWSRWHITLSTWFRDYLYISLGGSKGSTVKAVATGVVTMMLVGLWHGAGWQYIGFGVLMGGAIVVARLWESFVPAGTSLRRGATLLGPLIINYFLFVNWIVFRSVDWERGLEMFRSFFFVDQGGTRRIDPVWLLVPAAFFVFHALAYFKVVERVLRRVDDWTYAVGYGAVAAVALVFMSTNYQPFIYFQF
jgi:alginate O-acetyltransferase complex protein AlgI